MSEEHSDDAFQSDMDKLQLFVGSQKLEKLPYPDEMNQSFRKLYDSLDPRVQKVYLSAIEDFKKKEANSADSQTK